MNGWERLVLNVAVASQGTKKAGKRRLLTWTGISRFTNAWLKQRREVNIGVGMLMNW